MTEPRLQKAYEYTPPQSAEYFCADFLSVHGYAKQAHQHARVQSMQALASFLLTACEQAS